MLGSVGVGWPVETLEIPGTPTSLWQMQLYAETFRFENENDRNNHKDWNFMNSNKTPRRQLEIFNVLFSPERLSQLFLLKEVKPSPNHKIIRLLTFDNLFLLLRHSH